MQLSPPADRQTDRGADGLVGWLDWVSVPVCFPACRWHQNLSIRAQVVLTGVSVVEDKVGNQIDCGASASVSLALSLSLGAQTLILETLSTHWLGCMSSSHPGATGLRHWFSATPGYSAGRAVLDCQLAWFVFQLLLCWLLLGSELLYVTYLMHYIDYACWTHSQTHTPLCTHSTRQVLYKQGCGWWYKQKGWYCYYGTIFRLDLLGGSQSQGRENSSPTLFLVTAFLFCQKPLVNHPWWWHTLCNGLVTVLQVVCVKSICSASIIFSVVQFWHCDKFNIDNINISRLGAIDTTYRLFFMLCQQMLVIVWVQCPSGQQGFTNTSYWSVISVFMLS